MTQINNKTIYPKYGIFCFILFSLLTMTNKAHAQNLKELTLEDLNFGGYNYHNMIAKNRWTTWWGDELVRQDAEACYLVDKNTGKEKLLFTMDMLNDIRGVSPIHSLFDALFPIPGKTLVQIGSQLIDWNNKTITNSSTPSASVRDFLLFVKDSKGKEHQLTSDGSRDIVYGQSVHRDEFGISGGIFWSPDHSRLAFYRMDQSMVTDYPLVNIPEVHWTPQDGKSRIATPAPEKYPMAGETSHQVTVGVYDVEKGTTIYLKAGNPTDRYFTNIAWSPDAQNIYMFELNRDQNDCRLVKYDALSGDKIGEIYRETDAKYVEPLHPIQFLPWDNTKFILQSQKDGYNHLYLYNIKGEMVKQITSGKWVVMNVLGFNTKRQSIIYESNECSPIQKNIWIVDLKTGKRALMDDNGAGWHNGSTSESGRYIVDNYSTPTIPRNIAIINTEDSKSISYFKAENPWKGYTVPTFQCGTIKADDGVTDLYWRMVKPVNFDPKKKYPTIVYVYGGPHAHLVDASWNYGSRGWETYMAEKGYLLFILDNRGSENRGKDFEQVTFRHLGEEEMKDQMKGVDFLKSLPYVDSTRLGVHGWSFGGFMTVNMMLTYPDVFKCAVAGGPVIDWSYYEVMYGERYMDTPQTNPDRKSTR